MVIATGPALITLFGSHLAFPVEQPSLAIQDHTVTHGAVLNLMTVGSVCGTKGGLILMPVKIQKAIANKSQ